jgi:TetR/AcrR family hemagglutinin/protease transcriptional regulator
MVHGTARRRREKKIELLLDTALVLVGERGLEGLTVGALAARMDWTKGALYRYFRSKDQLIAALNGRVIRSWGERAAAVRDPGSPPLDQLRTSLDAWMDLAYERPAEFALISLTMADPRQLVEKPEDATHVPALLGLFSDVARLLELAAERGELEPGASWARSLRLIFALQGVLQLKKLARFDAELFDARALARSTASDLLSAWGAGGDR